MASDPGCCPATGLWAMAPASQDTIRARDRKHSISGSAQHRRPSRAGRVVALSVLWCPGWAQQGEHTCHCPGRSPPLPPKPHTDQDTSNAQSFLSTLVTGKERSRSQMTPSTGGKLRRGRPAGYVCERRGHGCVTGVCDSSQGWARAEGTVGIQPPPPSGVSFLGPEVKVA